MRRTPAESRYQVMMFAVLTSVSFLTLFLLFFRGRQSWGGLCLLCCDLWLSSKRGKKWLIHCILSFLLFFKNYLLGHCIIWFYCLFELSLIWNIFFFHIIRSGSTCRSVLRCKQPVRWENMTDFWDVYTIPIFPVISYNVSMTILTFVLIWYKGS